MTIVLDGTPLAVPTGGIRRYTLELARALGEEFPEDRVLLASDQPLPEVPGLQVLGEAARGTFGRRWWLVGLPRLLRETGASVFHGTDFAVPYAGTCPAVVTLHDLSPWLSPEWHSGATRVRRRTPLLLRVRNALVITPSDAIRKAALARFSLPEERVFAIPEAVAAHFKPTGGASGDYFLFVGTLEPRKNLPVLVDAFREIRKSLTVRLLIAGRRREDCPELPSDLGIEYLGAVPDTELPALYTRAIALVYPSLYEGFGLPVLEAMSCGTPVITSSDPALVEVAGGAALHVEAGVAALAAAMQAVALQSELRNELSARSLRRASLFSWARTARRTREVYELATRRP